MSAKARIQVLLDVPVSGSWSEGSTIEQIRKTAKRDGLADLRQKMGVVGIQIIGEPTVTIIVLEEEKR